MKKTADRFQDGTFSTPAKQTVRRLNTAALVDYFRSGIKRENSSALGIEIERFIVDEHLNAVSYYDKDGVKETLEALSCDFDHEIKGDQGHLLGLSRQGECITLEPAAQLETSSGPFTDLQSAYSSLEAFEKKLDGILQPKGHYALHLGYHPSAQAAQLPLIPKQRYDFMNRYLSQCDSCGPNMMRASASTQISIDYTDEADCIRKFRIAYALSPVFSLICDNTPLFENAPRTGKLRRMHVWQHTDNARCDLAQLVFSHDFSFEAYARFILSIPAILYPNPDGSWSYSEKSFDELYAEKPMELLEVEHALSMAFPDVRLKRYLEIRPADSLPVPFAIAFAALIKGLFYCPENLDRLDEALAAVTEESYRNAKAELQEKGYQATVYGIPASKFCNTLMDWAKLGLPAEEQAFLNPLRTLVRSQSTLADLIEMKLSFGLSLKDCLPETQQRNAKPANNDDMMLTVAYKGYFDDGSVFIDQTAQPISYPCTDGWMPPAFITGSRHLAVGQTSDIRVDASEAYEERTDKRIITVKRSAIPSTARLAVGEMLNLEQPDGQTYPARLIALDETTATFDMNHDAICKALNFQISLLEVQDLSSPKRQPTR